MGTFWILTVQSLAAPGIFHRKNRMGQDQETPKKNQVTSVVPSPDGQGLWQFWPRCLSEQRRWASKLANKCGICSRVIASSILRGPKVRSFTTKRDQNCSGSQTKWFMGCIHGQFCSHGDPALEMLTDFQLSLNWSLEARMIVKKMHLPQ